MKFRRFFAMTAVTLLPTLPAWAVELVMIEQPGCYNCMQWDKEIAPIYPRTEAGKHAPLRREQLHERPDDLTYSRPVNFTPTFILIEGGEEIARLEGYPGEDFFWWHIENMLTEYADFGGATK